MNQIKFKSNYWQLERRLKMITFRKSLAGILLFIREILYLRRTLTYLKWIKEEIKWSKCRIILSSLPARKVIMQMQLREIYLKTQFKTFKISGRIAHKTICLIQVIKIYSCLRWLTMWISMIDFVLFLINNL